MSDEATTVPSQAGIAILRRFLEKEAAGRLTIVKNGMGEPVDPTLKLEAGSGAEKAAAEKLERQGFGKCQWSRDGRFFWISEDGRKAAGASL